MTVIPESHKDTDHHRSRAPFGTTQSSKYRQWLIRLIKWDGMLPAAVWTAPLLIHALMPNRREAIEIAAIVLPVAAFLLRYRAGWRVISTNRCSMIVRRLQMGVFCIGILALALIDAVLMLIHIMPKGAAFATTGDLIFWCILFGIYFSAMAIAMYPGFGEEAETCDDLAVDSECEFLHGPGENPRGQAYR